MLTKGQVSLIRLAVKDSGLTNRQLSDLCEVEAPLKSLYSGNGAKLDTFYRLTDALGIQVELVDTRTGYSSVLSSSTIASLMILEGVNLLKLEKATGVTRKTLRKLKTVGAPATYSTTVLAKVLEAVGWKLVMRYKLSGKKRALKVIKRM